MGNSVLILALLASTAGAPISRHEARKQEAIFERSWNAEFVWNLDDLPTKSELSGERIPYSGYIYLDKDGGTTDVLQKYDRAFNGFRATAAASWEKSDASGAREPIAGPLGLLGFTKTHDWYGHCNGWAAASIRHAEPQRSVRVRGVEFSPAEIKGLLAEIYVYNHHEVLAGLNEELNAGTFHTILANWVGRAAHPVAMDSDAGKEKWNYPLYAYSSSFAKHSSRRVEVNTNILHAVDTTDREYDQSPRYHKVKTFHYMLQLNESGEIVGGYFLKDSDSIDFLWVPLAPKQPGESGNESGNPHVNVDRVLEIWRASVSKQRRESWAVIDPPALDRRLRLDDAKQILPRGAEWIELPPEPAPFTPAADAVGELVAVKDETASPQGTGIAASPKGARSDRSTRSEPKPFLIAESASKQIPLVDFENKEKRTNRRVNESLDLFIVVPGRQL